MISPQQQQNTSVIESSHVSNQQQLKGNRHRQRLPFFEGVLKLHRWFFDAPQKRGAMSAGKMVVGVSTMLMLVVVISGIILWVPANVKALKNRLSIKFNRGWRRFVYDSHVSLGIYASLIIIIMGLTGLTWSFSWWREGFVALFSNLVEPSNMKMFIYGLHTGAWGGITSKILYFFASLCGAIFPISGYYLWIKRVYRTSK